MRTFKARGHDADKQAPFIKGALGVVPFSSFAQAEGPHISLKAESVFEIFGLTVTNSMIYGVIITAVIIWMARVVGKKVGIKPVRGAVALFEIMIEFLVDILEGIFNSRKQAYKYVPIFGTFFLFIVLSNISGLLPVVGHITIDGAPVFRPFTADLNGTLALSVASIILVQIYSIKESGVKGHLRHYFTDKPYNPINFFIGLLEIFGEITRVLSLALRLFFNIAMGEILIAIFIFVGRDAATATLLPIVAFEILVAFIQAYVFMVLSATYLSLALHHDEHEHSFDQSPTHSDPEKLLAQELKGVT